MMEDKFNIKVTGFKYLKADGDDWVVDRVVMEFEDTDTVSTVYFYGGKFLWESFQCDERSIYDWQHLKCTAFYFYNNKMYKEMFELMFGVHLNLCIKRIALDAREDNLMCIRKQMMDCVMGDPTLFRNACECYIKLIESAGRHVCNNTTLDAKVNQVLEYIGKSCKAPVGELSDIVTIKLNRTFSQDIKFWGDLHVLNGFDSVDVCMTSNGFFIKLNSNGGSYCSDLFELPNDNDVDMEWIVITAMLNVIRKASMFSGQYQVEGILYDRDVVDMDACKNNEVLRKVLEDGSTYKFRYNVHLVDLIASAMLTKNSSVVGTTSLFN